MLGIRLSYLEDYAVQEASIAMSVCVNFSWFKQKAQTIHKLLLSDKTMVA